MREKGTGRNNNKSTQSPVYARETKCKEFTLSAYTTTRQITSRFKAFPTPTSKYKSTGALERRINKFFDPDYVPTGRDAANSRATLLDLAYWLGYKSRPEMIKAAYDTKEPSYSRLILAAIDKLNERKETELELTAFGSGDSKTLLELLKRNDNMIDKYNPELSKNQSGGTTIINLADSDRVRSAIEESILKLRAVDDAKRNAEDAEYEAIPIRSIPSPSKENQGD